MLLFKVSSTYTPDPGIPGTPPHCKRGALDQAHIGLARRSPAGAVLAAQVSCKPSRPSEVQPQSPKPSILNPKASTQNPRARSMAVYTLYTFNASGSVWVRVTIPESRVRALALGFMGSRNHSNSATDVSQRCNCERTLSHSPDPTKQTQTQT